MGSAQVISLSEVRASNQWQRLRDDLHTRFDQWLDRLQEQLPNPQTRLGIGQKYAPDFMRIRERRGSSTWASDRQKGFSCCV